MKKNNGYTLIELLVGMTIITVVFTVGIAGFRSFSRRQALTGVVKSVISDLRSSQQFALTGQKPTGNCPLLNGYSFKITSSATYQILANCDPDIITKTVNLPSGISISPNLSTVQFKVLGQGTNLTESLVLTLTNSVAGITNFVTIGTGGNVE